MLSIQSLYTPPLLVAPKINAALRRCVSELKVEYPNISFDAITDDDDAYFDSQGDERETYDSMAHRGRELFSWLRERPETNIVVVREPFLSVCTGEIFVSQYPLFLWRELGLVRVCKGGARRVVGVDGVGGDAIG